MTLKQILSTEAEYTYAIAERLFRRVSDDELSWRPPSGRDWMTVGQLLMHCASYGCGKAIQGFVTGDWGLPDGTKMEDLAADAHVPAAAALPSVGSVAEALRLLAEDRALALNCIAAANEEDLLERRVLAPWGGPEASLFEHLLHMIAHLTQHKGQLFYYLKLMGRDVNTADLWGA
jgi:uncharacterized damage-inducible protein DinB